MNGFISMVTPLLLHMAVAGAVASLSAGRLDATSATALTALLVIPVALWSYIRDRKWKQQRQKRSRKWCIVYGAFCFVAGGVLNFAWSGILNLFQGPAAPLAALDGLFLLGRLLFFGEIP